MGGGLSVGPGPAKRKLGTEFPQILQLLTHTFGGQGGGTLGSFLQGQPLLGMAQGQALGFGSGIGGLLGPLEQDFSSLTGGNLNKEFGGFGKSLAGIGRNLGGLSTELGGISREVGKALPGLESSYAKNINPILQSGGALTPEMTRDVLQQTDSSFAARGMTTGNQAFATELMNRDAAKTARYQTALGEGAQVQGEIGNITGEQAGIAGAQAGIAGQQAGILGAREGLIGQQLGLEQGLAGGIQGIQSGDLNQLTSTEAGITGNYAQLVDPLLSYAGNLFGGNLQASQSQQLANQNKGGAIPGQAGSVIGNILGGIAGSDKRLKEKIKDIGEKTPEGIPIKTFQFKGDKHGRRFMGVIAQDVEKHAPHAVIHHPGTGMKMVNFSAIHAPFHQLGIGGGSQKKSKNDGDGKDGEFKNVKTGVYGPIVGEKTHDTNFGPRGNKLGPNDVALSPDLLKHHPHGSKILVNGKVYTVADVSFKHPHRPNKNFIEFRDTKNPPSTVSISPFGRIRKIARTIGHEPMAIGRTVGHFPSAIGRGLHPHRGMPLGRSGFPRAIAVGGRHHHRGFRGGDSGGAPGGGGIAPGSTGFGGPGSGPGAGPGDVGFWPGGGGFPSSTSAPSSPAPAGTPAFDPGQIPMFLDPNTLTYLGPNMGPDYSGFSGGTNNDFGVLAGIQ